MNYLEQPISEAHNQEVMPKLALNTDLVTWAQNTVFMMWAQKTALVNGYGRNFMSPTGLNNLFVSLLLIVHKKAK